MRLRRTTAAVVVAGGKGGDRGQEHLSISQEESEAESIQPINTPFKQQPDEWEVRGISLTATGEPKSGTTWFARVLVELCLQLCGNPENTWCEMGGLTTEEIPPALAPHYEFEMLHAETGEVFLHFKPIPKHEIPGLEAKGSCSRRSVSHPNSWGFQSPCPSARDLTRDSLTACLPDTSPTCAQYMPPLDPAVRRMAVIFRDARNVVISEYRMRVRVYHHHLPPLERYIRERFEILVAWIHQRWVWHTTALRDVSRVMSYEDLQEHPHHLMELAAFVGLNCTADEADDVWQRHAFVNRRGDYTEHGLSDETLKWMNATMAKILPEAMLDRYGLTSIGT
eukprot:g11376.t1